MGDVLHAMTVVRARAYAPGVTVRRLGHDAFEVLGSVPRAAHGLKATLDVRVDGHAARVELCAGMTAEQLIAALELALPGRYELFAWARGDGGFAVVVSAPGETSPESSPSTA